MRKLKLFFACLLMAVLSIGQVWATDVTLSYTTNSTTNMTGNNDAATVGLDASSWSVVGAKGSNNNFPGLNKNGYIALYYNATASNTLTVTNLDGATISEIAVTYVSGKDNGKVLVNNSVVTASEGKYSIGASSFVITNGNTSNVQVQIKSIVITYSGGTTPAVLESIAVSGTPTTKNYEAGNAFDPAGLVVTGTYDVGDPAAITSNITWTACKTENGTYVALDDEAVALAKDETGIYVKATVSEITSPAFHVTGLTVTAVAPKITIDGSATGITTTDGAQTITAGVGSFGGTFKQYSTTALWFTSGTGYIYNTASFGYIRKITINYKSGGAAAAYQWIKMGNSVMNSYEAASTNGVKYETSTGGSSNTFVVEGNYEYFCLSVSNKNLQASSIVIEYEAKPAVSSIAIKTPPTKTTYTANENFDPSGLVLTVNYEGGSSEDVAYSNANASDFSFSPALDVALNATHTGNVTITYGTKTANQAITVNRIATSLEWSQSEFAVLVGATSPSYPTLTKTPNDLTGVTYSSSDESVALIDENTGDIVLGDTPGSSTITASFAQTDVYAAAEDATYTLTLSAATSPYLEVDPTALNFGDVAVDGSKGLDFTLSGSHLEADASLAISGTGAAMFSFAASVAKDGSGAINTNVTVTYNPTAAGTHTATLTITSEGATPVEVALSGEAKASHAITWSVNGAALSGDALDGVTTSVLDGGSVTALPAAPANNTLACANTFMGWSRHNWNSTSKTASDYDDLFSVAANAGTIDEPTTFYAVFATVTSGSDQNNNGPSWSRPETTDTYTDGYKFAKSGTSAKTGYYQDNTGTVTLKLYHETTPIFTSKPKSVTLTASIGAGQNNTEFDGYVYAQLLDNEGNGIGNPIQVNSSLTIASASGDTYTPTFDLTGITSAYGVKLYHEKESGRNVRYYSFSLSYVTSGTTTIDYVTKCAAVAVPTFSVDPADGPFNEAQSVTISCATTGAAIYYTTNGSTPTASSTLYEGPVSVSESMTLKAIAIKDADASDVAEAAYELQVATPTISGNTSFVNSATVTITAAEGTTIYYTDDESEPTTSSTQYTAPFNVTATKTIKAIAVKTNWTSSAVASETFTKITTISVAEAIELIPNTNDQVDDQYVAGTVCTAGTSVNASGQMTYYISADGSETNRLQIYQGKNLNNTAFSSASDLAVGDRVVVFGQLKNYKGTYEMNSGNYLVVKEGPAVATPVFTPDGGGFMGETDVTITCATEGNTIYYATDGTTPSKSSTAYTAAIHLNATTTIKAIAYVGDDASLVISKTFTLTDPMTVAEALTALDSEDPINNAAVTGIISTAPTSNPSSGKLTYYISDDGTTTSELKVYNGLGLNGAAFSAKTDLQVGDQVTVFGNLMIYNTTKEFDADNRLLTFIRPTVNVTGVTLPATANVNEGGTITLTPTIAPSNATNKNVSWSVISGDTYAEVSEEGVVTGLIAGGNAVIQVETEDGGYQATCTVTVAAARPDFTDENHEWIKITSASKLVAGRYYVIASETKNFTAGAISSGHAAHVSTTFGNGIIASTNLGSGTLIFELGGTSGAYTLTEIESGNMLKENATKSISLDATTSTWAITFDENGDATIGDESRILDNTANYFTTYTSATSNSMLLPQLYMWAELSHAVTFDANGGVAESVPGVERTDEGKIIIPETVPTHSDASKVFGGWYKSDAPSTLYNAGDEFSTSVDVTLYAKWNSVPTYTVTYVLGGTGTAPEVTAYPAGRKVTVATVSDIANPGYLFTGWIVKDADNNVLSVDENNQFTMPAANVTITAGWERESSQKWSLVKHDDVLALNVEYVIASKPNAQGVNPQKALGTINTDNYGNEVSVKIADEILRGSDAMVAFTIVAGSSDGKYAFKNGTKYLQYSGTGNTLTESETLNNTTSWTIVIDENDVATITNVAATDRFLQYNSGSSRFACYKTTSNQQNVQIYTKVPLQKVQNNETINSSAVTENSDVEVEKGGKLIVNANQKVTDMIVEAGGTVEFTGTYKMTITGTFSISATTTGESSVDFSGITNQNLLVGPNAEIFYDLTLGNGGSATQWHAFTVPFPVDAMNGVYDLDGNQLANEVNYAIMSYHGDVRAQGLYGWKKDRGILQPGVFYLMTVDGERTTYRFKKAAGALVADNEVALSEYPVDEGNESAVDGKDNGWNGVGNPNLFGGYVSYNVQMLNADGTAFVPVNAGENHKFAVGIPFFIQAGVGGGTMSLSTTVLSSIAARGTSQEYNDLKVTFGNEDYTDKLFISAREDALATYETGKDLVKMTMSSTPSVPQIFGKAYGHKLCMVDAQLANNQAIYDIDLYAPAAGTYSISAQQVEGATLYVTYNGAIVWNLSLGDYELDLTRGTTTGYGLLLVAQPNQMPTGLDTTEGVSGDAVQKILLNGQLYILRDGHLFDAVGHEMK